MSKDILALSSKPLRKKEEAILLLLYTIRMFDACQYISDDRKEQVIISIDKMNRIFYLINNKIFSLQFPFRMEYHDAEDEKTIYDSVTGTVISPTVLSYLIEAFEKMSRREVDFDTMFEIVMDSEFNIEEFTFKARWQLISYLLKYDLGYLRYDFDPEHEDGKIHPLNHLDICLDDSATYKIGLDREISFRDMKDILDLTTECWYFK
jgi:hypothetical protein